MEMQGRLTLIDAHAHLCDEDFEEDLPQVLQRAEESGVKIIITVGETLEDAERNLSLSSEHPMIRPCAGLYPTELDEDACKEILLFIERHHQRLVGVGEVGLDFWAVRETHLREIQMRILTRQVELANDLGLTLNVHSRSCGRHTISFLKDLGAKKVLMHAFDGKASAAREGLEAGYFFSVPPSVVRSPQKQKLVRNLPLERMLLESDSPVLGPNREARNEPANILPACQFIAGLKGLSPRLVADVTTENAFKLFPRAFP
jgi:TatD DNase family protein